MTSIRTTLDSFYPGLFNALIAVTVGGLIYGWRKFFPVSFEKLPKSVQAFPALVFGALMTSLSAQGDAAAQAFAGILSGAVAVLGHHVLKAIPFIPYQGATKLPTKPRSSLTNVALIFSVSAMLFGCGLFGGKPASGVIAEACTVLDSGNPLIGAICLTAEEIASIFSHVRATRAARAAHKDAASAEVDICATAVEASQ